MGKTKGGRKRGTRNKGYFFRAGRGWYATEGRKMVPLRYEDGDHIKEEKVHEQDLKESYARYVLDHQKEPEAVNDTTVLDVCLAYLKYAEANGATKTHFDRCDTLFDLCYGVPPEFRSKDGSRPRGTKTEREAKRIHRGFGNLAVREFTWANLDEWVSSHDKWNGGVRTRVQAVIDNDPLWEAV